MTVTLRPICVSLAALAIAAAADAQFGTTGTATTQTSTTQTSTTQPAEPVARPVARIETTPVPHAGDSADDPAVWVHPTDPALTLVLGTDKHGGLHVYDLDGHDLQTVSDGTRPDNVDVIYDVPLKGGTRVDLAIAATRAPGHWGVKAWRIDAATRTLADATADGGEIKAFAGAVQPYGSTVYHSRKSGRCFYFVTNKRGGIEQYELVDGPGAGEVDGRLVRTLACPGVVEGCVCDDERGAYYVAEEKVGVWRFDAEPDGPTRGRLVARVGEHGLTADVEGLTLYAPPGGRGYLIASSQGSSTFVVYDRQSYAFVETIVPAEGDGIDAVSKTDGIVASAAPAGPAFPDGLFVAQDNQNPGANQNFKLYRWRDVADGRLLVAPTTTARDAVAARP